MLDKIEFSRDRYRLGHTLIFFRAGGLAYLEEARDSIGTMWLRKFQGEALKYIRKKVFVKKTTQRELIKVAQRQFRKFFKIRDWPWFIIIQKTKPLIGVPDRTAELKVKSLFLGKSPQDKKNIFILSLLRC